MSYFEFPHTRSYDGDLGYIIKRLNELTAKYGEFMEYNQIKFADPLNWDINAVYAAWNIVFDNSSRGYYLAKKPVPTGIAISNTDYWELITPFGIDTALNIDSYNPIANAPVTSRFNQITASISNVSRMVRDEGIAREDADEALRILINANADEIEHLDGRLTNERITRETEDTNLSRQIDSANARIDNIAQAITPGTTSADAELIDIRVGANGVTYPTAGDAVRAQVDALNDSIDDLAEVTTTDAYTDEEEISTTWTNNKYVAPNGTEYSNNTYMHTNKISVSAGDILNIRRGTDDVLVNTFNFVTAYADNTAVESSGGSYLSRPFIVPAGINYVVFSISNTIPDSSYVTVQHHIKIPYEQPDVIKLFKIAQPGKPNSIVYKFNVTAGTTYTGTDELEDECAYRICFSCKFSSITDIVNIGKGIDNSHGGGFGFDGTNIYQYINGSLTPANTWPHGLTLKDYVHITLDQGYGKTAQITISTNGGTFTTTINYWRSLIGVLTCDSTADNLSDCVLSYVCEGLLKDTWIFGDSYLGLYQDNRWAYYLVNQGHYNFHINGFPGRNSQQALASFKVDLSMNKIPKRIIWAMGMNDKDNEATPNANWKAALTELISICEEYHIELILCTIPNVPSTATKNTLKNSYVESLTYRYIDLAAAVSANSSSTWYDDMLSSDNLHPDTQGALAIYNAVITAVPELLI